MPENSRWQEPARPRTRWRRRSAWRGGELADGDTVRTALGTGVAVSNFWYLNWSDRAAGRLTGMTRFASLWVENGEPVAPLSVMRFDDSLFRLLGSQLEALGRQVHRIPDADPMTTVRSGSRCLRAHSSPV